MLNHFNFDAYWKSLESWNTRPSHFVDNDLKRHEPTLIASEVINYDS